MVGTIAVVAIIAFTGGLVAGRSSADERGAAPDNSAAPTATVSPSGQPRVIIYGDSLVTQAEPYLRIVARALGLQVEVRALGGAAPCDSLPPLADDLAAKRVDLVVWAFSGNSIFGCMLDASGTPYAGQALLDKYRTDIEHAADAAEHADVDFVLASPPAPHLPGDPWERLDTVYREVAAGHPRIQYADAGVAISPDGKFIATQRCLPFELRIPTAREACGAADGTITVRGSDGHFCPTPTTGSLECGTYSSGALRYAINLLQAARIELDYQAQVAAGNAPSP